MAQLANCSNCGSVYVKNQFRDVCDACWRKEEEAFELVRDFIRKKENRKASMQEISEETGVSEALILKFIKKGRLNISQMPNVGYPCEKCGRLIQAGRLCERCVDSLKEELESFQREEKRKQEQKRKDTYHAIDKRFRGGH